MAHINLRVIYNDDRQFDVTVGPEEFVALEDRYPDANMQALANGMKLTWLYFLGWRGSHRKRAEGDHPGDVKPTFEAFMSVLGDVEPLGDDDIPLGVEVPLSG